MITVPPTALDPVHNPDPGDLCPSARVLVIDDEELVRNTLCLLMQAQGFDAVSAASGSEGAELLAKRKFEVAITDLVMPGMDGFQTIAALKAVDPDVEVMILTGQVRLGSTIDAMRCGACDFLAKPICGAELRQAVARALEKRRTKLNREDARARAVIETAREAIVLFTREGVVRDFNPVAEQIFGLSRQQALGRNLADFAIPPALFHVFKNHLEAAFRVGKDPLQGCIEVPALRQNGETFPFEISTVAIETPQGKLLSTFGRDITDRKRVLEALRASEEQFRQLAENIHAVFFVCQTDPPRLIYISSAYEVIWGRPCQEVYDRMGAWTEAVHPDDRASAADLLTHAMQGTRSTGEYRVVRPDGSIRFVLAQVFPLFDDAGKLFRIVGIAEDITKRKQAEQATQDSAAKLRIIFDGVETGIFLIDPATHQIVDANTLALELIGATREMAVGALCHKFICPAEMGRCPVTDLGQEVDNSERVLLTAGAKRIPIIKTVKSVTIAGRRLLLESFLDITGRKRAEEALRESEDRYRDLVENNFILIGTHDAKGKFLSVNRAAARLLEVANAEELEGRSLTNYVPPDLMPQFDAYLDTILREGHAEGLMVITTPSGQSRIVEYRNTLRRQDPFEPVIRWTGQDVTERMQAEKAQAFLASLVKSSQDAIIGQNREGIILSWNPGAEALYGYRAQEMVGKPVSILAPSDRQEELNLFLEKARRGEQISGYETVWMREDGALADVSLTLSPVRDPAGKITGAVTIARDITERKRTEKQTRLQTAALESAANGIAIVNRHGLIIWVNPAFARLTGYSPAECVGQNPRLLKSGVHDRAFYQRLWNTILSGEVWHGEIVNRRKDGTLYPEEMTITPVRDSSAAITHFVVIKQDITARKQTEQALAHERDLMHALMENVPDHIYFKDRESRFLCINAALARRFGLSDPAQAVGKTDFDFYREDHALPAYNDEQEVMKTGVPMAAKEEKETWPDGGVTWASTTKIPLRNAEGNIIGTFGVSRDITGQKRAEEDLLFKTALLEAESETTLDGILVVDQFGSVLRANQRFAEMMSLPPDLVLAGDDNKMLEFVLTRMKDPDAFLDRVKYLYAHESLRTREEIEMKDGRILDRYSSPLAGANGKKYGRVWYFRDITERKRAERSLEERTVYLISLFEISPMGIVVLDVEGRIQMSNSAFARLFLYSREEILGVKLDDLIVPPDLLAEARRLTALCMSGAGAQATRQRRQKNGTLVEVDIYGVPLNINGELQGTLALYQDITERQKAEADLLKYAEDLEISKAAQEEHAQKLARLVEELACERDLMGTLMDNLPDYIFYKDRQSRLLRTNPAHAHALGLSDPREAVGKTDFDFYPEEFARESFRTEQQVIETGQPLIGRIERARQHDGQDRWYLTSKVPIRDGQGNVTGLVGIARDITERRQAEETLRASEERYRELFENASDIVYTTGLDTRLTSLNRVGQRVLGYSGEEATRLDLFQLVAPRFRETVEQSRARLLRGESDLTIEVEITTKDGRTIMLEVKPRLIYRGGKPVGVQGIGRDITGRDAAEMELRHAQKLESVGRLASGIAHEINTPIQFVGDNTRFLQDSFGGLQTLLAKYQSFRAAVESGGATAELLEDVRSAEETSDCTYLLEEIPKALAQTLEGVTRVATIVRAMKEFAHPEGKEMAAADLNRALLSTLTVARNELKYVADVETELGDLPLVVCNVGDINQVFLNLLVNAAHAIAERVKGAGEKGKIHVRTVSEGDAALIAISDTGCGIPKSNMTKIFDPFFTTKEVGRGTGQGLAIARSVVVDRHKGSLTCDSEVGTGTTFFIRLPVDPGEGSREVKAL